MRALTVLPGVSNSARLDDVSEPPAGDGDVLVETLAIGICGTDREIAAGEYGRAPAGQERLIIGHESLGRILDAPRGAQLQPGDQVAGIVRRPDPVPCPACAQGASGTCAVTASTPSAASSSATAMPPSGFGARRNSPSRSTRNSPIA